MSQKDYKTEFYNYLSFIYMEMLIVESYYFKAVKLIMAAQKDKKTHLIKALNSLDSSRLNGKKEALGNFSA